MDDLGPVDETNTEVWKSIWAQVAIQEMPPKKKDQPDVEEYLKFGDWVVRELEQVMADKGGFHAHKDPSKGNFVNHDLLFSELPEQIQLQPTFSPKRLWRVTPQEHITRLNELINTEPNYNPKKPGLRTHGDAVSTNHGGELKLYFGVDRITDWVGGTVAYATAVKAIPVVLANARKYGMKNYADFSSVNSAEATQILTKAYDILKYMAYGPMSLVDSPAQITDDPVTYQMVKPKGDIRGLPSALTYNTKFLRPKTPVYTLLKDPNRKYTRNEVREAIRYLFEMLTFRPATEEEVERYFSLVEETILTLGREEGLFMGLSAIFLDRDALFRSELANQGSPDASGRVMLQDWELGLAVNHALAYIKPDPTLRKAISSGRMRTKEDVKREVTRMLEDDSIRKPRILQFFRDYFDYDLGGYICKDEKALKKTGVSNLNINRSMFQATASTDRLIELILEEDRDVLKELLTTQRVVAHPHDSLLFGEELHKKTVNEGDYASETQKLIQPIQQQLNQAAEKKTELYTLLEDAKTDLEKRKIHQQIADLKKLRANLDKERKALQQKRSQVKRVSFAGEKVFARVGYMSFGAQSLTPERKLSTAPEGQRLGILTHPAWLVSHSDAMDNHAIHRGIWVRKRLLGGGIPDVPITVDAQLPDEPHHTLRERMRVTQEAYCWSCHEKMDPLGLPFEMYNHAGLYRQFDHGKPVDASGEIIDSGDPELDGPVTDAFDMIQRLSESERVEQVFVRHAFRFWMGRNETLHDAPVLQAAHQAYRDNGGSMKALLVSLLTSDAFLYRK